MSKTEETTEIKTLDANEYQIMDAADEQQIIAAGDEFKKALVYEVNGKKELSYVALKHLTLLMSQSGQPLEVMDCKMELLGDTREEKIWYATVKIRNKKTGHETVGMSEQPYLMKFKDNSKPPEYDPHGRTKALSKAERNAWRKQIPEFELKRMLNDAIGKGEVKTLDKICDCRGGTNKVDATHNKCLSCGGKLK